MGVIVLTTMTQGIVTMHKVIKVLPFVVIVVLLASCIMPTARPFAAMPQAATSATTTDNTARPDITPPLSTIESCTVIAAQSLNLRSGAGTNNDVVKVLYNGDVLMVRNQRGAWWEVIAPDNTTGYINSNYCNKGK